MKFSVINFACLTIFVTGVHLQIIKLPPDGSDYSQYSAIPHSASIISLGHDGRYIHKFSYAADAYPDVDGGNNNENFVYNAQQLAQAFQGGKRIVDCSSNMTAGQTILLAPLLHDLDFEYHKTAIHLETLKRKIMKKSSLCEITRKQLTDINNNGQALLESILSKGHPEVLKYIGAVVESFKQSLRNAPERFSERNCEKNCFEDCYKSCRERCKKSCKNCKGDCVDCEDNCEENCPG